MKLFLFVINSSQKILLNLVCFPKIFSCLDIIDNTAKLAKIDPNFIDINDKSIYKYLSIQPPIYLSYIIFYLYFYVCMYVCMYVLTYVGRGFRCVITNGTGQPRQLVLAVLAAGVGVIENLRNRSGSRIIAISFRLGRITHGEEELREVQYLVQLLLRRQRNAKLLVEQLRHGHYVCIYVCMYVYQV